MIFFSMFFVGVEFDTGWQLIAVPKVIGSISAIFGPIDLKF